MLSAFVGAYNDNSLHNWKTNWGGNVHYRAADQRICSTDDDIKEALIKNCASAKVVGTRHSFSAVSDSEGTLLFLAPGMNQVVSFNDSDGSVTVQSGIMHGELGAFLSRHGRALSNYASLPHISVGGSISTPTHGSGSGNTVLAGDVLLIRLILANGTSLIISHEDASFSYALLSVGALGVIADVTLRTVPVFDVAQCRYVVNSADGLVDSVFEYIS